MGIMRRNYDDSDTKWGYHPTQKERKMNVRYTETIYRDNTGQAETRIWVEKTEYDLSTTHFHAKWTCNMAASKYSGQGFAHYSYDIVSS